MSQPDLFYESYLDALKDDVKALGGAKKVGGWFKPEKDAEAARNWLDLQHRARCAACDRRRDVRAPAGYRVDFEEGLSAEGWGEMIRLDAAENGVTCDGHMASGRKARWIVDAHGARIALCDACAGELKTMLPEVQPASPAMTQESGPAEDRFRPLPVTPPRVRPI